MRRLLKRSPKLFVLLMVVGLVVAACGGGGGSGNSQELVISGIPDQEVSVLEKRFNGMAQYLADNLGVKVRYAPTVDYAAVVTAFKNGDMGLAFYGGLTGVQARVAVPGAKAIAQRPQDEQFHSVFIAHSGTSIQKLEDLKGHTFTFGSASSTSGYTMPLFYLSQKGISPDRDFKAVNYSGSHDKTWKLVESGAFDAGALNVDVWNRAVRDKTVDLSKVYVFFTTPSYYDYHWVVRPDLDQRYGKGFTDRLYSALMSINADHGGLEADVMKAFDARNFIPTQNDNYKDLEAVARQLGLVGNK